MSGNEGANLRDRRRRRAVLLGPAETGADPSVGEQGDKVTGLPVQFGNGPVADDRSRAVARVRAFRDDGTLWCWGRNCGGPAR